MLALFFPKYALDDAKNYLGRLCVVGSSQSPPAVSTIHPVSPQSKESSIGAVRDPTTVGWWMRGNEDGQCSCRSSPTLMTPSSVFGFFSGTPDPVSNWLNQTFRRSGTHAR